MAYGFNANQQAIPQMPTNQNVQPLFPQPQGNVYSINSTLEVANVPVGAGMSIALCLPENVMYIKTIQNGNPMFYPYKIEPYMSKEPEQNNVAAARQDSNQMEELQSKIAACQDEIKELKEQLKNTKGGFNI